MSHTKGPWEAVKTPEGWQVISPHVGQVAVMTSGSDATRAPNARLIAAAPRMFDILQYVRDDIEINAPELLATVEMIEKVLSEAEGK